MTATTASISNWRPQLTVASAFCMERCRASLAAYEVSQGTAGVGNDVSLAMCSLRYQTRGLLLMLLLLLVLLPWWAQPGADLQAPQHAPIPSAIAILAAAWPSTWTRSL